MKQTINLFQSSFHPRKDPFRSRNLILVFLAAAICIGLVWGLKASQVSVMRSQVQEAKIAKQTLQQQVLDLESRHPAPTLKPGLQNRLAELRQGREDRLQLLATLEERPLRSEQGFAEYLQGLARQRVKGLWLSNIEIILDQAEQLLLKGRTSQAEFIPRYLRKLSTEETFSGITFQSVRMERLEEQPEIISFSLATRQGDRR